MRFQVGAAVLYKGCQFCCGTVIDTDESARAYLVEFGPNSATGEQTIWCAEPDLELVTTETQR